MFPMNLQLFAESEENIEPEDEILPEESEESSQPEEEEKPAEETKPEADKPEPRKIKVKFNHEEMELPEEEAVPLIQKGMNYDKLQEKYNQIQSDPRLGKYEKVSQISKLLGYQTDDQLIDALYQNYYQLTAQQKGLTPQQIQKEHELQQQQAQIQRARQIAQQRQQQTAVYANFLKAFPDVQAKDIKPETWEKVKNGMDLTAAYVQQQNGELMEKYKALQQKIKNKDKAPVGGVTEHGTSEPGDDPFLDGFNSI
mgnify:CR=1 FL=1